jgi:hypothetical protein
MSKEINVTDNPLAIDKEIFEELKLPAEAEPTPIQKLSFLQAQLEEFKAQAWRSRVDAVHARRLMQSDIETLRLKGNNNLSEHKNATVRLSEGIVMTKRFIEQLREEYPELQVED